MAEAGAKVVFNDINQDLVNKGLAAYAEAGIEAKVDVYPKCFHAFDMILPFKEISKVAIMKFEEEFVKATKTYFAKQNK